jgi:hypothetical protein
LDRSVSARGHPELEDVVWFHLDCQRVDYEDELSAVFSTKA